ncbi:MAG: hypothetical protein Aureis2KO_17280 [Aureisphaera sp.]
MENELKEQIVVARKEMQALKNDFKEVNELAKQVGKSGNSGGGNGITAQLKKNIEVSKKLNIELEARKKLERDLDREIVKNTGAYSNLNKELQSLRVDTQRINKEKRIEVKLTNQNIGAYEKLKIKVAQAEKEYKELAAAVGTSNKQLGEAKKKAEDLRKALNKIEAPVKKLKSGSSSLKTFGSILAGVAGSLGVIEGLRFGISFLKDARRVAQEAKGVEFAFSKIEERTRDAEAALVRVRKATKGLLSDLDIKKAIVELDNFNISTEETDTLLEFLAVRAAQTGQSVDKLRDSLVEGLSKESKLRIDNLGISAGELNDELEKSPNFVKAVANIARKEIKEAGDILNEAANSQDKFNASLKNFKLFIGKRFVSGISNAFLELGTTILNTIAPVETMTDKIRGQQVEFNVLATRLAEANLKEGERLKIINEINKKYPEFVKNIDLEKATTEELADAIKKVNDQYINRIILQKEIDKAEKLGERAAEAKIYQRQKEQEALETLIDAEIALGIESDVTISRSDRLANALDKARENAGAFKLEANALLKSLSLIDVRVLEGTGGFSVDNANNATDAYIKQADAVQKLREELGLIPEVANTEEAAQQTGRAVEKIRKEIEEQKKLLEKATTKAQADAIKKVISGLQKEIELILGSTESKVREKIRSIRSLFNEMQEEAVFQLQVELMDGNISAEEYIDRIEKINEAFGDITEGIDDIVTNKINPEDIIAKGTVTRAAELEEKIKSVSEALKNLPWEEVLNKAVGAFGILTELGATFLERSISNTEREIEANAEKYDKLLEQEGLSNEEIKAYNDQRDAEEERLQEKKRQKRVQQAILERTFNIGQVASQTALAVAAAASPPPVGVGPVLAPTIVPFIIASGAAQATIIAAQPLPQYKTGRSGGPEELAIVGDGGKHEPIIDKHGKLKMISPDTPTLIKLAQGDSVLPDVSSFKQTSYEEILQNGFQLSQRTFKDRIELSKNNTSNKTAPSIDLEAQIRKGFSNAKINITNNNDFNYRALSKEIYLMIEANKV